MISLHKHKSASHPNFLAVEATYQDNRNSNPYKDIHQRNKKNHPNRAQRDLANPRQATMRVLGAADERLGRSPFLVVALVLRIDFDDGVVAWDHGFCHCSHRLEEMNSNISTEKPKGKKKKGCRQQMRGIRVGRDKTACVITISLLVVSASLYDCLAFISHSLSYFCSYF